MGRKRVIAVKYSCCCGSVASFRPASEASRWTSFQKTRSFATCQLQGCIGIAGCKSGRLLLPQVVKWELFMRSCSATWALPSFPFLLRGSGRASIQHNRVRLLQKKGNKCMNGPPTATASEAAWEWEGLITLPRFVYKLYFGQSKFINLTSPFSQDCHTLP